MKTLNLSQGADGEHSTMEAIEFKSVAFDAATLEALEGGTVTLNGNSVQSQQRRRCGHSGWRHRHAQYVADQIGFGSGTMATVGFGNGVNLTAREGLFSGPHAC